jgi:hypothetical protein
VGTIEQLNNRTIELRSGKAGEQVGERKSSFLFVVRLFGCSNVRMFPALICIFLCVAQPSAGEVQLTVDASSRQIYLGDPVTLTVRVSGLRNAPPPDLSAIADCTYALQDSRDQNYQHATFINGKMQRTVFRGRIFIYRLTPGRAGTLPLGPVRLSHGGQIYQTDGPQISVVGIEKQDHVRLRLETTREKVIVDEAFEVTLAVSILRLPGNYASVDPFNTGDPPDLTVPHLQLKAIAGLESQDTQKVLQGLLISGRRSAGFGINGFTMQPDALSSFLSFDGPGGASRALFRLKRSEETIDGKAYLTYRLRTRYVPKQEGTHSFGPITFKGRVFTTVDAAGQATTRPVYAMTRDLSVQVIPPPSTGRPASYIGAIGSNIVAEASLDTQTCNVGDPIRLTLSVRGAMSVDNLRAPALTQQPDLAEVFRVYADTVESTALPDGKTFTYTVRPIRAGTIEFPAVEIAYYDSTTRRYEVVRTAPIPLVAYQADEVQEDFIVAATNDTPAVTAHGSHDDLIPAPITLSPAGPEAAPPWLSLGARVALVLGPSLFALIGMVVFVRLRLTTTAESRRRRAAIQEALRLVERAEHKAGRSANEARALLMTGLRKYLANRWGGREGGITPRDAARLLREHGVDRELSHEVVDVLDRSFNAAYDPSAASAQNVQADAKRMRGALKRLEKLALGILLVLSLAGVARGDVIRERFLWEEANTHMATAAQPQDYLRAAETYRELYAIGHGNGALLYNMGTAFLMAGRYDAAYRALRGAEVYSGTTPAIERNMVLASMEGDPRAQASLPWYRLPLFWHFGGSLAARITWAVAALSLVWLVGILRLLGWRRGWRRALAVAVAATVLLGSSVLLSLHELQRVRTDLTLLSVQGSVE